MAAHHRLTALLLLLCSCSTAEPRQGLQPITLAGCPDKCGDVSIPFPFGTKPGCFLPGFQVYCNTSFTPPRAFLAYNDTGPLQEEGYMLNGRGPHLNYSMVPVELMDVSAGSSEARAYGAVTSLCYTSLNSSITKLQSTLLAAEEGPFLLSAARNILVGVGWNVEAAIGESLILPFSDYKISCSGLGYCNASLSGATQLRWFGARIITSPGDDDYNGRWKANPCSYSMLVERSRYNFSTDDTNGYEVLPRRYPRGVPFVIDFAIRDATGSSCPRDGQPPAPGFACVSGNSSCANAATGKGYVCRCWEHYDGNPYITNGCLDINECEHPDQYPCSPHGVCRNKLGGYDCPCKLGMKGDGKNGTCTDIFPLAAKVVLGTGLAVFSMVVLFLLVLVRLQKRMLKELLKTRLKNVNCAVYTKDEINKYTRDFSIPLGNGKFGQVYKGTLPHDPQEEEGTPADTQEEGTTVAVKKSIKVTKETVEKFAEEVKIQAQMIHNNVLKLLGYCLDVDGPMLVYEFADNKDLEVLLHGKDSRELPLELRLDIAIGAAEGLKYMHGNAAKHIRHGDVKPDNILLHGKVKVVPKISDFGLSRLLTNPADGDLTKDVIGALGYIDPVFIRTNKQSLKNDVYSFGVVLLELITRKKVECVQNPRLVTDFREVCQKEGSGSTMFDKDFNMKSEEDISILEEIGKLALECLKDDCGDRPDMKEVAHRLETLKRKRWRQRGQDATSPQDYVKNNVDDFPSDADVPGASNYTTSPSPLLPKRK